MFGLILPYIGVIVLFGYLVALINQRKDSKNCDITDSYEFKECDLPTLTRTSTEVLSDNNSGKFYVFLVFLNYLIAVRFISISIAQFSNFTCQYNAYIMVHDTP